MNTNTDDQAAASQWRATAFNQVPHSKNEIHGDNVAKEYGFKGGLVPGVTVSAYLMHPAAVRFGLDFAERGFARCRVSAPLYDGEAFVVELAEQSRQSYAATLLNPEGLPRATAEVILPEELPMAPQLRGDPVADNSFVAPMATPENMQTLRENGCHAFRYVWRQSHEMSTYLSEASAMADIYSQQQVANPSFILGISNWVLASNAVMNPWVHMETTSQNFAVLRDGARVIGEMTITDLFAKKGHEFVDASVNLFDADNGICYASVQLRAIYRLRSN